MWYSEMLSGAVVVICALVIIIAGLSSEVFKLRRRLSQLQPDKMNKK